jgi:hypothetical protein
MKYSKYLIHEEENIKFQLERFSKNYLELSFVLFIFKKIKNCINFIGGIIMIFSIPCRNLIFLFFILISTISLSAQPSAPVPYDLSNGKYQLLSWDSSSAVNPAGTYPPNMVFHQSMKLDPLLEDEMDADWKCPYNLDSRSRISGLSDDGFSFCNTGQVQDSTVCDSSGYVGEAVLALRTVNHKNINVSWNGGFVSITSKGSRQYCIRLQYRLGNSGSFIDVTDSAGNPVEYNYSGYINQSPAQPHDTSFSVILPQETEDKILVQLRWKYYYQPTDSSSGARPKLKVDDIIVSGEIINGIEENDLFNRTFITEISPNPANSEIELKIISNRMKIIKLKVTNLFGIEVLEQIADLNVGENNIKINLSQNGLPPGIYYCCTKDDEGIDCRKIIFVK